MHDSNHPIHKGTQKHGFFFLALVLLGLVVLNVFYQWSVPKKFQKFQYLKLYKKNITQIQLDNPYKLLLPIKPDGPHTPRIRWVSSSLIPAVYLANFLSPYKTHLLLTSLLVLVAFCCSYFVLRSPPFSILFSVMIMVNPGLVFAQRYFFGEVMVFMCVYMCLNFFAFCKILIAPEKKMALYLLLFASSLVLLEVSTMLCLNYVICIMALCILVFFCFWRGSDIHRTILLRRVVILLVTVVVITVIYLIIRMQYLGEFLNKGHEEELLLTYPSIVEMIECLFSNVVVFIYISFTAFLPPFFSFPNALTLFGREAIIEHYWGVHKELSEHYFYHNLFFWYQAAGMVFLAYMVSLVTTFRRALQKNSTTYWIIFSLLITVFLGSATYYPIKIRPYLSLPILCHKTIVSLFFLSILTSYLVWITENLFKNKKVYYTIYTAILITIVISCYMRIFYVLELFRYITTG